jgi:hypothetical protein
VPYRDPEKQREAARLGAKRRRAKNPEPYRLAMRRFRLAHPDYDTAYYRANPGKMRAKWARRESRIELAGTAYTRFDWQRYLDLFGDRCLACGQKPEKLTADHVVPLAKGGTNTIENIQGLCQSCNSSKGTKAIDYRLGSDGPLGAGGSTEGPLESLLQPAEGVAA